MSPQDAALPEPSRRQRLAVARAAVRGVLTRPHGWIPFFLKRLGEAELSREAAALSFSSAIAVVPALALILGVLAAFPAFDHLRAALQNTIITNLVPDTGLRISDTLTGFVEAAGKLTAFGFIGLLLSAILLYTTIQGTLNAIFRVIYPRPWHQRLLAFWTIMTIGPILLGVGASLLGYFNSPQLMEGDLAPPPDPAMILLGNLMPTLLTWMTLIFVFKIVPNRRLKMKDVMIGAAIAAVLLAVLRYSFAVYIIFMTSYQAIYGAIAAVPVFLLWLYLVWLAVLVGAVVASSLPDWRYARVGYGMGVGGRMVLALEVLARFAAASRGGAGLTVEQLTKVLGAPDMAVTAVFHDLRAGLFIAPTEEGRWVLSRDMERTPLSELVHHFGVGLNLTMAEDGADIGELSKRLNGYLRAAAESERALLGVSLAQVLAPPASPPPPP